MKPRLLGYVILAALLVLLVIAARTYGADDPEPQPDPAPDTVQGKTAEEWHGVAERYLSRKRSLERALRFDPETVAAINLACIVYGHCPTLWRKARCESKLWRYAHNKSGASGLFQFLPSTWRSTPYRFFSIYDPYANALAAGWMHAVGRGGEWDCR